MRGSTRVRRPRSRPGIRVLGATAVLCGVLAAAALAASTNFSALATSPEGTGDGPSQIAAADLNGDGKLDLAISNERTNSVTILKNTPASGNFVQPSTSPEITGNAPSAVSAADLDGDGDTDLVIANSSDDTVSILRNNGGANFVEAPFSPKQVGDFPFSLTLGDFDGDADPDLAVANEFDDNVSVFRNPGTGNFAELGTSPEAAGSNPVAIETADLDGDADLDLAAANLSSANLTVLRNGGHGNFTEPSSSPEPLSGGNPRALIAARLDGDADVDLAVTSLAALSVVILKNNGKANFTEPSTSPELLHGSNPTGMAAADFDADGDQDLAIANNGSGDVTILRNFGSANFTEPATSPEAAGAGPNSVAAAPLDADADPDLAVTLADEDGVAILGNN